MRCKQNKLEANLKPQNQNVTKIILYLNLHPYLNVSMSFGVALTIRLLQKYLQIEQNMYVILKLKSCVAVLP